MSRYLSFLRKKVHGGQNDPSGMPGFDKRRKNNVQGSPKQLTTECHHSITIHNDDDSLMDNANVAENKESNILLLSEELSINSSVHITDGDEDDLNFDSTIDEVIENAFSDLEIDLLTDTITDIKYNIGEQRTSNVHSNGSNAVNEESIVIITETTEEEIVDINEKTVVETIVKQSVFAESIIGTLNKNEFTIKIMVPSENETSHTVNNCGESQNLNKGDIHTCQSFAAFPSEKFKEQPLRHSKSCEGMRNAVVLNDSMNDKISKRSSTTVTSSEEEFDSAKETLSDDDVMNVTRIYVQPTTDNYHGTPIDEIDCSVAINYCNSNPHDQTEILEQNYHKVGNSVYTEHETPQHLIDHAMPNSSAVSMDEIISENAESVNLKYISEPSAKQGTEEVCSLEQKEKHSFENLTDESVMKETDKPPAVNQFHEIFIAQKIEDLTDSNRLEGPSDDIIVDEDETSRGIIVNNMLSNESRSSNCSNAIIVEDLEKLNLEKDIISDSNFIQKTIKEECLKSESVPKLSVHTNLTANGIDDKISEETSPTNREKSASPPDEANELSNLKDFSPCDGQLLYQTQEMMLDNLLNDTLDNKNVYRSHDEFATNSKSFGVEQDILENVFVTSVCKDHDEAEARLAQRRAARVEAREMRLKELEKQQQDAEDDNDEEKQYVDNDSSAIDKRMKKNCQRLQCSPNSKTPSRPTRTSVGRSSLVTNSVSQISRRSSEDSIPDDVLPAFAKELKSELKEMEEKFRKAMITNAQFDNEKATLTYEVEFLKDKFTELEELHNQLTKEHMRKRSENEQLRKLSNKLKEEMKMLRKILQEREQLIQEYGLVVVGEEENGEGSASDDEEMMDDTLNKLSPRKIAIKKALLSQEAADLLSRGAAHGSLDVRLKKYAEEKNELEDEVRRLKMELEEEVHRRRKENGLDSEKQKATSTYINEYKLRIEKSEAEVSTLQANVARLESLVTRYKAQSEELEKSEDELKIEKRKLLREFREIQTRLEETELINFHLQKRFDKLKTARSTLLKDLSLDPA